MNPRQARPPVRIRSAAGLLAVIPHLIGFTPEASLVVLGTIRPDGRVEITLRYDLPDPPDHGTAADIAGHAAGVLAAQHLTGALVVGYGPGPAVTPVADAIRATLPRAGLELLDVLRVHEGRYWSYLCSDPSCCPPAGVPFDPGCHPDGAALAAAGRPVLADRAALAATIVPLTGPDADAMRAATRRAAQAAGRLITREGLAGLDRPGLAAVRHMIGIYRDGGSVTSPDVHAWLAISLARLRIRDDAWARMDPGHRDAHRRLWTDLVRRAQPGYIAAPASLLAFTAWQCGEGALANIALDRALTDNPGYSLALLIRDAIGAGAPPSMAVLPMTPDQVTASYASPQPGDHPDDPPATG